MPKSSVLGTTFLITNKSCTVTLSFQTFKGLLYVGCVETGALASTPGIRDQLGRRKEKGKDGTSIHTHCFQAPDSGLHLQGLPLSLCSVKFDERTIRSKKDGGRKKENNTKKIRRRNICRGRQRKKDGIFLGVVALEAAESLLTQTHRSQGNQIIMREGNKAPRHLITQRTNTVGLKMLWLEEPSCHPLTRLLAQILVSLYVGPWDAAYPRARHNRKHPEWPTKCEPKVEPQSEEASRANFHF